MLAYVAGAGRAAAVADACSCMLTYAHVCSRTLAYVAGAGRAAAVADEARVKRRRRGTQLEMLMNLLPPQVRAQACSSSLRPHTLVA
jgi:hypothetical protein